MRLIDADAAIEAIANCSIYGADEIKTQCEKNIYEENGWLGGLKDAIEAVEDMPTIEQTQTGKWDSLGGIMDVGDGEEIQCNKCKATYMIVYRDGDYNFCPNCGARMVKK